MIKSISKGELAVMRPYDAGTPAKISDGIHEDGIAPDKLLTELKSREALLTRLIKEGHKTESINELRQSLTRTITELEEILKDPDLEILSTSEPVETG